MIISKSTCPSISEELLRLFERSYEKPTFTNFLKWEKIDGNPIQRKYLEEIRRIKMKIHHKISTKIFRIDQNFLYESGKEITTGSAKIDDLLFSGFQTGEVFEIYGKTGTGKTQLCLTTSVFFSSSGQGTVIYFDTKGVDLENRIREMYNHLSGNENFMTLSIEYEDRDDGGTEEIIEKRRDLERTVQGIRVIKVSDIFQLQRYIHEIRTQSRRQDSDFNNSLGVVIIDSIANLISPTDYLRSSSPNRIIHQTMSFLRSFAVEKGVCVIVTNYASQSDLRRPYLGYEWNLLQSFSLGLFVQDDLERKTYLRTARVGKGSTINYERMVQFVINDGGVCNIGSVTRRVDQEEGGSRGRMIDEDDSTDEESSDDDDDDNDDGNVSQISNITQSVQGTTQNEFQTQYSTVN